MKSRFTFALIVFTLVCGFAFAQTGLTLTRDATISPTPSGNGWTAAWSPNGSYLAVGAAASTFLHVWFYDGSWRGVTVNNGPCDDVRDTQFSHNGDALAVAVADDSDCGGPGTPGRTRLAIYDSSSEPFTFVANNVESNTNNCDTGRGRSASWRNDTEVSVAGGDRFSHFTLYSGVLTCSDGEQLSSVLQQIEWAPDGTVAAASQNSAPYVDVIASTGTGSIGVVASPLDVSPGATAVSVNWTSDSQFFAAGTTNGDVHIYQRDSAAALTFTRLHVFNVGAQVNGLAWLPTDNQFLAVGFSGGNFLEIWDPINNVSRGAPSTTPTADVWRPAFSPDCGQFAAPFHASPFLYVYDTDCTAPIPPTPTPTGATSLSGENGAFFGGNRTALADSFGITADALEFLYAAIFIVGFTMVGWGLVRSPGAIGGAIAGVVFTTAFGWIPLWFIVLLIAAAAAIMVAGRRNAV